MNNLKKSHKKSEHGQALILIVFAIIGLIGITGLTVDGGLAYSDRRHAQNAADAAAYAAALAHTRGQDLDPAGQSVAASNGYTSNVVITTKDTLSGFCNPNSTDNLDITVTITSVIQTSFARVVGIPTMTNVVIAKTRACGTYIGPLFNGNAIVSLNPNTEDCAYFSGSSSAAHWTVTGGGIFSNGCAESKDGDSVTLDEDQCVSSVGGVEGGFNEEDFTGCVQENQTSQAINYPADALAIMPPNPCDGTPGDVGLPQPAPSGGEVHLTDGIYCISDFDAYDSLDIILSNATMYVTDMDFDLKFAGGGGFAGTPTNEGVYNSYFMIIAVDTTPADDPTPCESFTSQDAQVINYRGNGSGTLFGTVLAPSACIDLRGNAEGEAYHSQIIGYNVSSNGNAEVLINYEDDENRRDPQPATISLIE